MANDERLRELEDKYEGFTVYDRDGDKKGKVDDLFVDDSDREEYIGVKMGLFGLSGTTLIPMEMARVDERERRIEVSETKEHVKDAPNYSDDDVTADFEERIRRHFGIGSGQSSGGRDSHDRDADRAADGGVGGSTAGAASTRDDTVRRDRDDDDRYSGAAMGGAEDRDRPDRDRTDQDRIDQDRSSDDRYSGAPMGGAEDKGRMDEDRMDRDRGDRSRGASDDAGSMTRGHREGEGTGEGDQGGAIYEGYLEGYREGMRDGMTRGGGARDEGDRPQVEGQRTRVRRRSRR
jgi:hypothetical protein